MKHKSISILMIVLILLLQFPFSTTVYAEEDARVVDVCSHNRDDTRVCSYCGGISHSHCKKDYNTQSISNHTVSGVNCMVSELHAGAYYECELCHMKDYTIVYGRHLCLLIHSTCYKGTIDYCWCHYS